MERPLRREVHGGCGERPGETSREQSQYRALGLLDRAALPLSRGAGAVEVTAPRVHDKRTDPVTGERKRFSSAILIVLDNGRTVGFESQRI